MENKVTRADFLRGRFRKKTRKKENAPSYLALPDAVPHPLFESLCDGCGDCLPGCPSNIVFLRNTPNGLKAQLDFTDKSQGCLFCGQCSQACQTGALDPDTARPWHLKAKLNMVSCLSLNGIVCRTCGDVCDSRAITFRLMTGGRAFPEIETENCTGCGTCVALCPVQAVTLQETNIPLPIKQENEAVT